MKVHTSESQNHRTHRTQQLRGENRVRDPDSQPKVFRPDVYRCLPSRAETTDGQQTRHLHAVGTPDAQQGSGLLATAQQSLGDLRMHQIRALSDPSSVHQSNSRVFPHLVQSRIGLCMARTSHQYQSASRLCSNLSNRWFLLGRSSRHYPDEPACESAGGPSRCFLPHQALLTKDT